VLSHRPSRSNPSWTGRQSRGRSAMNEARARTRSSGVPRAIPGKWGANGKGSGTCRPGTRGWRGTPPPPVSHRPAPLARRRTRETSRRDRSDETGRECPLLGQRRTRPHAVRTHPCKWTARGSGSKRSASTFPMKDRCTLTADTRPERRFECPSRWLGGRCGALKGPVIPGGPERGAAGRVEASCLRLSCRRSSSRRPRR